MPKRKRGGLTSKPKKRYQRRKTKPPRKPKTKTSQLKSRAFWQPCFFPKLLNFSPYNYDEECVRKVFFICSGLIKKLEAGSNFFDRIDSVIWKLAMLPKKKKKMEIHFIDQLIKIASQEIRELFTVLKEIHRIEEKECFDVMTTVAERDSVFRPSITLLYPLLLELGSLLPVWMGNINEMAPPMVGAIPARDKYVVKPGQYVAAFVLPDSGNKPDSSDDTSVVTPPFPCEEFGIVGSWILARVLEKRSKTLYIIADMDNVPNPHYCVKRSEIIPLPLYRADPKTNPEAIFPVGAVVLALYKYTTCFFPAVVLDTPKTLADSYTLYFRDLSNKLLFGPVMHVQQRYVIKFVEAIKIFTPKQRKAINSIDVFNIPKKF